MKDSKWKSEVLNPYQAIRVYLKKKKKIHEICGAWHKIEQLMTFGGIFSENNLASSIKDVIILTNFYFYHSVTGLVCNMYTSLFSGFYIG